MDLRLNKWDNAKNVLAELTTKHYFNRPSQMTYHDLQFATEFNTNPLKLGRLLGLGHKFCIQEEKPKPK